MYITISILHLYICVSLIYLYLCISTSVTLHLCLFNLSLYLCVCAHDVFVYIFLNTYVNQTDTLMTDRLADRQGNREIEK